MTNNVFISLIDEIVGVGIDILEGGGEELYRYSGDMGEGEGVGEDRQKDSGVV